MKILYQCEICKEIYPDRSEGEACEAKGVEEALFEVGEFVVTETAYGRFGWFDGDKEWVVEREKDFRGDKCKMYSLIYVITAITHGSPGRPEHRLCYHLFTRAMTGVKGHDDGYTFSTHTRGMAKVETDLDASDLIGRKSGHLM